ncbi:MAG: hypothetical protein HKN03_15120 [Acidimicrobiales bacterium]|nr:hypothetical protein [Acidimicrobiales bacterium]
MSHRLTIRRKVALTLALPIIALGLLAAIGYASSERELTQAQDALEAADSFNSIHAAARAIGDERLAYVVASLPQRLDPEADEVRITEATERTETALGLIPTEAVHQNGVSAGGINSVRGSLTAARSTPVSRSVNFSRAVETLLGEASGIPVGEATAADQQNRVDLQNLHRWIETTEIAWVSFAERASDDLRPTAEVIDAFARADALLDVLEESSGTSSATIDQMLSATAVLEDLRLTAVEDLLNPAESIVSPSTALMTLQESRTRWNEAVAIAEANRISQLQSVQALAESRRNQFGLFGLFGMLAFGVAGLMLYHAVTAPITATAAAARSTLGERLPAIVTSLKDPEATQVRPSHIAAEVSDELGQLVEAVNAVQDTFYDIAHVNAMGRKRVAQRTVAISRRNARLLHDLVRHVATWRTADPDQETRSRLFQIDHIATRMQRNVEASMLLAGAHSERQWTHPVTTTTTARLALGEVGEFNRVDIAAMDDVRLNGNSAPDVAHILAELIENGLNAADRSLDPITQRVRVECTWVSAGLAFTVHDTGVGLSDAERSEMNQRLHTPYAMHEGPTRFVGLYVVAMLAKRYGIDVRILEGPNGGTVVRVVLPVDLVDPATVPHDRKPIDAGRGVTVGVPAAKINDTPVQTAEQESAATVFFGEKESRSDPLPTSSSDGNEASSPDVSPIPPLVSPIGGTSATSPDLMKLVGGSVPPPVPREIRNTPTHTTADT